MRYFFWIAMLVLLCGACSGAPTPSRPDPNLSLTATAGRAQFQGTLAAVNTQTAGREAAAARQQAGPSPTPFLVTYPAKQPLLLYFSASGGLPSPFDMRGLSFLMPRLFLYSDGQLLMSDNKSRLWQAQLSKSEIDDLLSKLRALGFFQLQSGPLDKGSPLYDSGAGQQPNSAAGAADTVIQVLGNDPHEIGIDESLEDHLTQPVQDILSYLNSYSPGGLTRYLPDRLLVRIIKGRARGLNATAALPWPADLPAPDQVGADGVLYLEGPPAGQLYQVINPSIDNLMTFNQNDYTLYALPIFPHQCLNRVIDPGSLSLPVYQQVFTCQDNH